MRTAESLARWLAARPAIAVISRDRHGPSADAVRRGAPDTREVADRFRLVSDLQYAIQEALSRVRGFLVVPHTRQPGRDRADGCPPDITCGRRMWSSRTASLENGARRSS